MSPLPDRPADPLEDPLPWLERMEADDLRRLVATLPVIEQAKGVLMGYYGIGAPEAFALLRRWSSTGNVKIRVLCAGIVAAAARPHPERHGGLRDHLQASGLVPGSCPTLTAPDDHRDRPRR